MTQTQREPLAKEITLSNSLHMRYYEWPGAGPNLVLLHPSSGYGRMWDMTARALDGQLHIFAPDQRGHGDTARPDGSYSAEEYAEDLHLFISELGLGRAFIGGHSLGGRVAQAFAVAYPEETGAIILVAGPHYSNFFPERDRVIVVLEGAERMRVSQTEFMSQEAALAYLRADRPDEPEQWHRHRIEYNTRPLPGGGLAFKYDEVRVAQGLTHMADNLRPYAQRTLCPVAIIRGSRSTRLTREEAQRMAAFWRDARIMEVEGDYFLEMENPERLAQVILEFARSAVKA